MRSGHVPCLVKAAKPYAWKNGGDGMEPSEATRLMALEYKNAKLKWLLDQAMLEKTALKDLLSSMR